MSDDIKRKSPAWHDEDDDIDIEEGFKNANKLPKMVESDDKYRQYLERKFQSIYEPPSWAQKALQRKDKTSKSSKKEDSSDSDDEQDDEEYSAEKIAFGEVKSSETNRLRKDFLHVKKCTHLNASKRIKTALNCVQFHPSSTVALVGSNIGLIKLFKVDGKRNASIQSIYFKDFRLSDAKFLSANGQEEIIVGSDGSNPKCRGYCYYYDMTAGKIVRISLSKGGKGNIYSLRGFQISPDNRYLAACGDNGQINILTTSSKELIQETKVNGQVNCLSFSPDSQYLIAHGHDNGCQAFIFDIRNVQKTMPCVNRFYDVDTIVATAMDISPTGHMIAIGSNMGVVNLYGWKDVLTNLNPTPLKSIMNLTTSITSLRFNHDGQLLLMASDQKNDSIRFVNTNSKTVYKNFPLFVGGNTGKTYGSIKHLDFSPNSGYFSFVTGYGTAHLFRINEYSSY